MLPFETEPTSDDDLLVLASYATAEREAALACPPEVGVPAKSGGVAAITDPTHTATAETGDRTPSKCRGQIWVPRIREVEGVPEERMVPIHGRLIAHGLLHFQLQGQSEGVRYRLSSAGRSAVSATSDGDKPSESEAA